MKLFLSATTVLCLLASCQLVGPDEGLSIEAEGQQHAIGEEIKVTVSNTGRAVYVNHCCDRPIVGLDVLEEGGEWKEVFGSSWGCTANCDGRPLLLEPGFRFSTERFRIKEAGTYRLWIQYGHSRSFEEITETVLSDEFVVVAR